MADGRLATTLGSGQTSTGSHPDMGTLQVYCTYCTQCTVHHRGSQQRIWRDLRRKDEMSPFRMTPKNRSDACRQMDF